MRPIQDGDIKRLVANHNKACPAKEIRTFEQLANEMDAALIRLSEEVSKAFDVFNPVLKCEVTGIEEAKQSAPTPSASPYIDAMKNYINKIYSVSDRLHKLCDLCDL